MEQEQINQDRTSENAAVQAGGAADRNLVSIVRCETYDAEQLQAAIQQLLQPLGGLEKWVHSGMRVGLKINMVSGKAPETAVTTNPYLVRELCRMISGLGAEPVVGDSPGGLFNHAALTAAYHASHMECVQEAGAVLNEDFSVKNAVNQNAVSANTFSYTGWLDSCDILINVCKLKTHGMMKITCAVKNLFGTIPGTTKPEYHMRFPDENKFADMLVDLNQYFHPVLNIVDAIDCMEGNGPTAGTPRHMGAILASESPYALDVICADLIGVDPEAVPTVQAACRRGLGPLHCDEVQTAGEDPASLRIPDFVSSDAKTVTFAGTGALSRIKSAGAKMIFATRPQVNKGECIGCQKCFHICPAHAITMVHDKPQIDRSKCIHCFCCQEFCPKGAMKVHQTWIAGLLSHMGR